VDLDAQEDYPEKRDGTIAESSLSTFQFFAAQRSYSAKAGIESSGPK